MPGGNSARRSGNSAQRRDNRARRSGNSARRSGNSTLRSCVSTLQSGNSAQRSGGAGSWYAAQSVKIIKQYNLVTNYFFIYTIEFLISIIIQICRFKHEIFLPHVSQTLRFSWRVFAERSLTLVSIKFCCAFDINAISFYLKVGFIRNLFSSISRFMAYIFKSNQFSNLLFYLLHLSYQHRYAFPCRSSFIHVSFSKHKLQLQEFVINSSR